MKVRALTLIGFCLLAWTAQSFPAHADCTTPPGLPGAVTWNGTDAVIWCDGTNWNSLASGGGGSTLAGLSDVDVAGIGDGKVLTYNNTTSKWEPTTPSAALSGGTSGYLGVWSGATTLGLSSTSGGQQLYWDSTNHRLGIGRTNPDNKLDVQTATGPNLDGLRVISGSTAAVWVAPHVASGSWNGITQTGDQGIFFQGSTGAGTGNLVIAPWTGGTSGIRLTSGGNVGIGAPGPVSTLAGRTYLTVKGASDAGMLELANTSADADGTTIGGVQFSSSSYADGTNGPRGAAIMARQDGTTATDRGGRLEFHTKSDAGLLTERMRLTSNGNVGIGMIPNANLDIGGPAPTLRLSRGGTGGFQLIDWTDDNQYFDFKGDLRFRDGINGVGSSDPLTITSTGNVGIGTTVPDAALDIESAAQTTGLGGAIRFKATAGNYAGLALDAPSPGAAKSFFMHYGDHVGGASNNQLRFGRYADNFGAWEANPYTFDMDAPSGTIYAAGTGDLGIGTVSPAAKLDVAGGVRIGDQTSCTNGTHNGTLKFASNALSVCTSSGWSSLAVGANADTLDGLDSTAFYRLDAATSAPDTWLHTRVIRNAATGTGYPADGMFIGYQNSDSGLTRIYSGGSVGAHYTSDAAGNIIRSDGATYWHSANDGTGSMLDADLLDGLNQTSAATGNTIMSRDANGDGTARYLNMSHAATLRTADTTFYSSDDNYIRKNTAAGFRTSLDVYSKGEVNALGGADNLGNHTATTTLNMNSQAISNSGKILINRPSSLPASGSMATATANLGGIEVISDGNAGTAGASFLTFHRPGNFATYLGIDTDSQLKIGGWSLGAAAYKIWHENSDGSGSGLDADLLDGQDSAFYRNASNLNAGTVASARLGSGTANGTTFLRGDGTWNAPSFTESDPKIVTSMETGAVCISTGTQINCGGDNVGTKDNITTRTPSGFWQTATASTAEGWPVDGSWYHLTSSTHSNVANYYSMQFAGDFYNSNQLFYRATNGSGTTAWNKLWHGGNDGSGSTLDADLLDGLNPTPAATGNTIMSRDANGDSWARYIVTDHLNMSHAAWARTADTIFYSSYDDYIRKNTAAGFRTSLDVYSKGEVNALGGADNLGNHTATTTLNMNAQAIANSGKISISAPSSLPASGGMATAAGSLGGIEILSAGSAGTAGASFLTFHRPGSFATYLGLDTDNQLKIGGWSMGAAAYKIWHQNSDGSGSGLDADLLDGLNQTSADTGSTIMSRDANGDSSARYFNTSYLNMSHGAAQRNADTTFYSSDDNYIRKNTAAGFRTSLDVYSKGEVNALAGDNLGNHTATTTLNMNSQSITNIGTATATSFRSAAGQNFKVRYGKGSVAVSMNANNGVTVLTGISLGYTFTSAPVITITGTAMGGYLDALVPTVINGTTSAFDLYLFNAGNFASGTYTFNWIAMGD